MINIYIKLRGGEIDYTFDPKSFNNFNTMDDYLGFHHHVWDRFIKDAKPILERNWLPTTRMVIDIKIGEQYYRGVIRGIKRQKLLKRGKIQIKNIQKDRLYEIVSFRYGKYRKYIDIVSKVIPREPKDWQIISKVNKRSQRLYKTLGVFEMTCNSEYLEKRRMEIKLADFIFSALIDSHILNSYAYSFIHNFKKNI